MNNISSLPADKESLLQFVIDKCQLNVPVSEAADMTLAELGIDSLELLELAIEMEGTFRLSMDVNELGAETTLSSLIDGLLKSAA